MAGNAVILKHAAQTLLVGERFQRAFDAADLPQGLFQNLALTHAQTARLIATRAVDQVNFTGSVAGGQAIEAAAAGGFLGVGLELGGKDPGYVRADADLAHAVETLVDGAFFNSGPVLLRHRAHLCRAERLRRIRRRLRRADQGLCARRSARRGDDARAAW